MKKSIALWLALTLLLLTGCGAGGSTPTASRSPKDVTAGADLTFSTGETDYPYGLSQDDGSRPLSVSETARGSFSARLDGIRCVYPYQVFFGVEEMFDRIDSYRPVERHQYSALDADGRLTADHLTAVVKENNRTYMAGLKNGRINLTTYSEPEDAFLARICALIADTVEEMLRRFPEIDRDRVFCNLGNLKILHEKGVSMHLAAVNQEMVLAVQDNILTLAEYKNGKFGIRNTIIHEIMHILQFGCVCEKIENCLMRHGCSFSFSDAERNALSYLWLVEGAAEKETCLLTGGDILTYVGRIGYIGSLDYATFLQEDVPAYYAESIPFYSDPELLFGLFDCAGREEKLEVADMMRAIEIVQTLPKEFLNELKEKKGLDVEDDAVKDEICFRLKPPVCLFFTRYFYRSLLERVAGGVVTERDLYCLIRLFEGLLDQHLGLWENRSPEIDGPFLAEYAALRGEFFSLLAAEGNDVSLDRYLNYDFFAEENVVNAGLKWLPEEKIRFLFDRADALAEKDLLGKTTPVR